jgi:hypothetical protein
MPAFAGICGEGARVLVWVPAFAGMTRVGCVDFGVGAEPALSFDFAQDELLEVGLR